MRRRKFGGQTVTVVTQLPARHNEYVDGPRRAWSNCSLQPQPDSMQESTDRQQRTEARYRLFAPPGFRAAAQDEVEVVPGPVDETGRPARLKLIGPAEPWFNGRGREDHVAAVLRRRLG